MERIVGIAIFTAVIGRLWVVTSRRRQRGWLFAIASVMGAAVIQEGALRAGASVVGAGLAAFIAPAVAFAISEAMGVAQRQDPEYRSQRPGVARRRKRAVRRP